jgi:F-type H+-transporting ATPase subunit a
MFPLVATFFIFIIVNNWAGLIPGFGSIGIYEMKEGHEVFVPFLRSANADLNTTIMLSLVSVIVIQIVGIGVIGLKSYTKKFFNFSSPILFFVGILELISEFIKIISFSFRLFGNVFAGEVLLIVITMLVPYILPIPFYGLELFVGFIQALVFTMLTLVFIKMATIEAH